MWRVRWDTINVVYFSCVLTYWKNLVKYIAYIKLLFSTIKLGIEESVLNLRNKDILVVSLSLWQTARQAITLRALGSCDRAS